MRLDAGGQVTAYLHRVAGTEGDEPPSEERAREWAERALREVAGPEAAEYRLGSSRERGQDGLSAGPCSRGGCCRGPRRRPWPAGCCWAASRRPSPT